MPDYHLVKLKRDGEWVWTLGLAVPFAKVPPRLFYKTIEEAEAEKARLIALEKPKSWSHGN